MMDKYIEKIKNKENNIFIFQPNAINISSGMLNYIYNMAYCLDKEGYNVIMFYEKNKPTNRGKYSHIELLSLAEMQVKYKVNASDFMIIPELYIQFVGELLKNKIPCEFIILAQTQDFMFENMEYGQRWDITFNIRNVIVNTDWYGKYIKGYFPNVETYTVNPQIPEYFSEKAKKLHPYVAIFAKKQRDGELFTKKFFAKHPHLAWIAFKAFGNLDRKSYNEELNECAFAVCLDENNTFGTFPLEVLSKNILLLGQSLKFVPDWMDMNNIDGIWGNDEELIDYLEKMITAWLYDDYDDSQHLPTQNYTELYSEENFIHQLKNAFEAIKNNRINFLNKIKANTNE